MDSSTSISLPDKKSLALGAILILAFAVYTNTLLNGFVYDDHQQVEENPYAHSARYAGRVLTTTVWSFQGAEGQTNYYRPLMTLTFLVCNKAFQSLPYGFHLVNILFNCVVVWLVFFVGTRLLADETVALVAAGVFALHPIHTEVVAWISSVTELELTIFSLAAFSLFVRLGAVEGREKTRTQILMHASFVVALLSKEQGMTLLLLAAVYEHFYRPDRGVTSSRVKASRYRGFCLIGAAYLVFRASVLGGLAPVMKHPDVTRLQVVLSSFALFGEYIGKLFWPHPLLAFYVFHKSTAVSEPQVLLGMGASILLIALFAFLWRRARIYSFALIWIIVTLAPVLNARWMATNVFTERYLYLPSVGFCWLMGAGIVWLYRRAKGNAPSTTRSRALAGAALGLCAVAAAQVVARNRDWRDDEALLSQTLSIEPHASLMRTNLGSLEWNRQQHEKAENDWRTALAEQPDNPVALSNMGLAMIERKRYDEAQGYLQKAIQLRPRYAAPHIHLGHVYAAEGRPTAAEAEFRKAVEIYPLSTEARNALAKFYFDSGRFAEGETQYRASVDSGPTEEAWNHLGDIYLHDGAIKKAEEAWRQALVVAPYDSHAHLALGGVYFGDGRRSQAEKEYRDVLLVDPANAEARERLRELGVTDLPTAPAYRR